MHATVSSGQASYRTNESRSRRDDAGDQTPSQEEFESIHARRALFRALGEASPVIAVLLVLLIFSVIP